MPSPGNESKDCYVILQYFDEDSGWGPAAVSIPGTVLAHPVPFVYTGTDESTIQGCYELARLIWMKSGKPTKLVRYESRVDLLTLGEE